MSRSRWDYKICPDCGAVLDVGESCDCQQENRTEPPPQARNFDTGEGNHITPRRKRVKAPSRA